MDWKKTIAAVAPGLATALGGPLAGVAAAAVSDALLGKPTGTEVEIATALRAGGTEALAKLREADQAFAIRCRELGIDLERIHQQDRADARGREVKTGDRVTPRVLAGLVVGGFIGMVWYVLTGKVTALTDPIATGMIGTLIGYVSAKADQVVSYYFGSTASSAQKTELLAQAPPIK